MKTFIKWSGNKSRYSNNLLELAPSNYKKYIEPFVGSGAMFLKTRGSIISDANRDLIDVWKFIGSHVEDIIAAMLAFDAHFSALDKRGKIDMCRAMTTRMEILPHGLERAVLYLILKNCVYMGVLLRHNKYYFRGLDMSLYGRDKVFSEKYYDNLREVSSFLKESHVKIHCRDYKKTLARARQGDFVFLDPPYIESHGYDFKYNLGEVLDEGFLQELLVQVRLLDKRGVKWMMTQADTPEIRRIFKSYDIKKFKVYRRQGMRYVNELVIRNYV